MQTPDWFRDGSGATGGEINYWKFVADAVNFTGMTAGSRSSRRWAVFTISVTNDRCATRLNKCQLPW
jgi:outer membrane receptor for monomeric catechols